MDARRKLRKKYKINQVDSFILWGSGCRNTGIDKEQEQLSLDMQDSEVQVQKKGKYARLEIHSEYCSEGNNTMLLVETNNCSDHKTDLTDRRTVRVQLNQEYD
jgi:hypothetical protein